MSARQTVGGLHCSLAHDMINKLSIIVGQCELLEEKAEAKCAERLLIIRQTALAMAVAINHGDCRDSELETLQPRRSSTINPLIAQ